MKIRSFKLWKLALILICTFFLIAMFSGVSVAKEADDTSETLVTTNPEEDASSDASADTGKGSDKDSKKNKPEDPGSENPDDPDSDLEVRTTVEPEEDVAPGPAGSMVPVAQSMSFSGAATQSIPIVVPPGRNGIGPNLSLTYNSMQKNGWIGVGWSLDMGAIQRSTKRSVDYTADDYVASVAGSTSELVKVDTLGNYRAKIEGAFSQYYNPDPTTTGWVVTTKDGTTYYYGSTAASRQNDPSDNTKIFKWCLDKVEDSNGNYMEISYEKNAYGGNEIYLQSIVYTGNSSGLSPAYQVEFITEDQNRDDFLVNHVPKFEVRTKRRLSVINVYYDSTDLVRSYELSYGYSALTGRSLLQSIQQVGRDENDDLPPIVFEYQAGADRFYAYEGYAGDAAFGAYKDYPEDVYPMDVNGDRKTDIVVGPDDTGTFKWLRADGGLLVAGGDLVANDSLLAGYKNYPKKVTPMDVNGDGRTDMVVGPDDDDIFYYYESDADSDSLNYMGPLNAAGSFAGVTYSDATLKMSPMDINGDGMMDLLVGPTLLTQTVMTDIGPVPLPEYVKYTVLLANKNGDDEMSFTVTNGSIGSFITEIPTPMDLVSNLTRVRTMDVNGDGYTDLLFGPNIDGQMLVWESNGVDDFITDTPWLDGFTEWQTSYPELVKPADVNGDGLQDLVYGGNGDGEFKVLVNNGTDFVNEGIWIDTELTHLYDHRYRVRMMDVTGDGMSDVVIGPKTDAGVVHWIVLRSLGAKDPVTGEGFVWDTSGGSNYWAANIDSHEDFDNDDSPICGQIRPMDLDGDGLSDMVLGPEAAGKFFVLQTGGSTPEMPDLLKQVQNGAGGFTQIEYTPSAQIVENADHAKLPFVVQLASAITINDGLGNSYRTTYEFTGGDFDHVNRDFWGFKTAVQHNPDESRVETTFHQSEYLKGRQEQVRLFDTGGGEDPFGTTDFTWETETSDTGLDGTLCEFVKLGQKTTEFTDDQTVRTTEIYWYNSDCGGIEQKEVTDGETSLITESDWINVQAGSGWMWRLDEERLKTESLAILRQTNYNYDPLNGNLLSKEYWLQYSAPDGVGSETGHDLTETFTYDAYGNPTGGLYPGGNSKPEVVYETDTHTYPQTITNALGHSVEKTYDYGLGKVLTETDPNDFITVYHYDDLGRLYQVNTPNTGQVVTDYSHMDSDAPNYVISTVSTDDGDIVSYQFFDGLGRAIQSIAPSEISNRYVVARKTFDYMSRVAFAYGPYFSSDTISGALADWVMAPNSGDIPEVETSYDARGRVDTVTSYDKSEGVTRTNTVTYAYSGLTTTVTDPDGKSKSEVKDFLGRVVKVIEYGDQEDYETLYEYNNAGDLKKVTDTLGNETSNAYDTLGRKRYMNDPDMGVWHYGYDDNGNLASQTDAEDQTIAFTYDVLDRVTIKQYTNTDDLDVYYAYDQATNGVGMLYKVEKKTTPPEVPMTEAATTYDAYDSMGQATQVTRSIDGIADQTTSYAYDRAGRLESIVYPDSSEAHHTYHSGTSLLSEVTNASGTVVYATISDYTPSGKIGYLQDGSGADTTYIYEPFAERLTGIRTVLTDNPETPVVQNKSYVYSGAGDIVEITDNLKGLTSTYEYDALHRLKNESYSDPALADTFKPVAIVPDYTGTGPVHAVKRATVNGTLYTYTYDGNGNMTQGWDYSDPEDVARRDFTYNADNMPDQITRTDSAENTTTVAYTYDGEGGRVKKVVNGTSSTYYVNGLFEIKPSGNVKYIFAGNLRVAMVDYSGTYYFQKDHLGSTAAITKLSGSISVVHDENLGAYLPFGGQRGETSITKTNYAFTDQERDPESGLYNYGARLYDPVVGMFITPDSIVQNPYDPQTLNRYSYCRNNPLVYVDPSGHLFGIDDAVILTVAASMLKGAAYGAAISGAVAAATGGDIGQAMLSGAISGAIFGGIHCIPGMGDGMNVFTGVQGEALSSGTQAGIHFAGGALAGGINAGIHGGDIGKGMVMGGISAGIGKYAGMEYLDSSHWSIELLGRSVLGGVTGGIAAEISGGDFGDGFINGARSAAIAQFCNDWNDILPGIGKAFSGAYQAVRYNEQLHAGTANGFIWSGQIFVLSKTWVFWKAAAFYITPAAVQSAYSSLMVHPEVVYGSIDFINSALPGIPALSNAGAAGVIASNAYDWAKKSLSD